MLYYDYWFQKFICKRFSESHRLTVAQRIAYYLINTKIICQKISRVSQFHSCKDELHSNKQTNKPENPFQTMTSQISLINSIIFNLIVFIQVVPSRFDMIWQDSMLILYAYILITLRNYDKLISGYYWGLDILVIPTK